MKLRLIIYIKLIELNKINDIPYKIIKKTCEREYLKVWFKLIKNHNCNIFIWFQS